MRSLIFRFRKAQKMKNLCISILLIAIIVLSGIAISLPKNEVQTEYLRIHVRANSNTQIDQSVKYVVKDKIVEYLTPYIAECNTKQKAEVLLENNLSGIEKVANSTLKQYGFSYTAKASVKQENFPTRVYGSLELESGIYDALIIELGSGKGDNWWCVVYPPLCFTSAEGGSVIYRSKILSIISDFYKKEKG